jgi:hypothetical protein
MLLWAAVDLREDKVDWLKFLPPKVHTEALLAASCNRILVPYLELLLPCFNCEPCIGASLYSSWLLRGVDHRIVLFGVQMAFLFESKTLPVAIEAQPSDSRSLSLFVIADISKLGE